MPSQGHAAMKSSPDAVMHTDQENDRRRYRRYVSQPMDIEIHTGTRTVRGQLVNESIGGLAIYTHDASNVHVGQEVETEFRDGFSPAFVRSVRRVPNGKYRVSVSWDKQSCRDAGLCASYLAHEDLLLVCEILCEQNGPVRTIKLWDGAEFAVPTEAICTRSFEQRRDELNETPTKIPVLARIYGLDSRAQTAETVSKILNFEFSSQFDTHTEH
jgi:hypothetical protein